MKQWWFFKNSFFRFWTDFSYVKKYTIWKLRLGLFFPKVADFLNKKIFKIRFVVIFLVPELQGPFEIDRECKKLLATYFLLQSFTVESFVDLPALEKNRCLWKSILIMKHELNADLWELRVENWSAQWVLQLWFYRELPVLIS